MLTLTIDQFRKLVLQSRLCSFAAIDIACSDFDANRSDQDAVADFCKHLVSKSLLTEWQCEMLRQGKWKGFHLDGYRLLDHIGQDATTSTYLVEDLSSGNRVAMVVSPPALVPMRNGQPHYEIRDLPSELDS